MKQLRYQFVLEAIEPIAHHSESFGNSALLMRRKVRQPDGTFAQVPIITGDTMRHGMREAASYALLDAAGMMETTSLTESALRLLFSGGMITGRGDAAVVQLDRYREMVELIPHISLFGGCAGNRMIPGRLIVSDATLICSESTQYIRPWIHDFMDGNGTNIDTCRAYVEEVQRVRMDPMRSPQKRTLLSGEQRCAAEDRIFFSETAHKKKDVPAIEENKSSMMPRRYERLVQGSMFAWSVEAACYSEIDIDTFDMSVASFLSCARVGGKQGTGHGRLRAIACSANGTHWSVDDDRFTNSGEIFAAHVKERAQRVAEFLAKVDS